MMCICGHDCKHLPATPTVGDVPGTLATCSDCLDEAMDAHRARKPADALFARCRHEFKAAAVVAQEAE